MLEVKRANRYLKLSYRKIKHVLINYLTSIEYLFTRIIEILYKNRCYMMDNKAIDRYLCRLNIKFPSHLLAVLQTILFHTFE